MLHFCAASSAKAMGAEASSENRRLGCLEVLERVSGVLRCTATVAPRQAGQWFIGTGGYPVPDAVTGVVDPKPCSSGGESAKTGGHARSRERAIRTSAARNHSCCFGCTTKVTAALR